MALFLSFFLRIFISDTVYVLGLNATLSVLLSTQILYILLDRIVLWEWLPSNVGSNLKEWISSIKVYLIPNSKRIWHGEMDISSLNDILVLLGCILEAGYEKKSTQKIILFVNVGSCYTLSINVERVLR